MSIYMFHMKQRVPKTLEEVNQGSNRPIVSMLMINIIKSQITYSIHKILNLYNEYPFLLE